MRYAAQLCADMNAYVTPYHDMQNALHDGRHCVTLHLMTGESDQLDSYMHPEQSRCISEGMTQLATMRGQHSIASGSSLRQEVLACRAYPHLPVSAISPLSTRA